MLRTLGTHSTLVHNDVELFVSRGGCIERPPKVREVFRPFAPVVGHEHPAIVTWNQMDRTWLLEGTVRWHLLKHSTVVTHGNVGELPHSQGFSLAATLELS